LQLFNLQYNGVIFFATGFIDQIIHILADNACISRNDDNIELVDFIELRSFSFCRTGHTGKFFVEAEKVLDGDGRHGLRFTLNLDILLGLDGLVQSVAVAATGKDTSGKLIDNHHLPVLYHIFVVALKE